MWRENLRHLRRRWLGGGGRPRVCRLISGTRRIGRVDCSSSPGTRAAWREPLSVHPPIRSSPAQGRAWATGLRDFVPVLNLQHRIRCSKDSTFVPHKLSRFHGLEVLSTRCATALGMPNTV